MKASRSIPSAHKLPHDAPVSATPTAFASQIGQFPPYDISPSTTNRQNKRYAFHPVSAGTRPTPAMHFQRACRQCVHESARLFRVICSHAWYR